MILKNKRQVVIINDIKSDKIEQAIFILRDKDDKSKSLTGKSFESDIVLEAHRIINGFLYPGVHTTKAAPRKCALVQGIMWLASSMIVVGITVMIVKLITHLI